MEATRTATRYAAVVAKQRQVDALRHAQNVVDGHTRQMLSHLSVADRELIRSVTGEVITDDTTQASQFALTLAQSRMQRDAGPVPMESANTLLGRSGAPTMHDRIATFTSMRALIGSNAVGRSLDLEA